jgi:hypothetical protein
VNISGLNGESLAYGAFDCMTFYEETSTMKNSMDGGNGNGGVGGWNTSASIVDECDGRGGEDGCHVGASTRVARNKKDEGGRW